ncbi:hypothetical protein C8R45DRAFT_549635 [Mycena sanguinolenta]|nr:hypothetical protein C8R45DRAFT_549635 [Mycena sanguinolenta]
MRVWAGTTHACPRDRRYVVCMPKNGKLKRKFMIAISCARAVHDSADCSSCGHTIAICSTLLDPFVDLGCARRAARSRTGAAPLLSLPFRAIPYSALDHDPLAGDAFSTGPRPRVRNCILRKRKRLPRIVSWSRPPRLRAHRCLSPSPPSPCTSAPSLPGPSSPPPSRRPPPLPSSNVRHRPLSSVSQHKLSAPSSSSWLFAILCAGSRWRRLVDATTFCMPLALHAIHARQLQQKMATRGLLR